MRSIPSLRSFPSVAFQTVPMFVWLKKIKQKRHHLEKRGTERGNPRRCFSWKDKRGPSSIRWTSKPFQRQRWGNFWETGWSTHGHFRVHRYHPEPNWTEQKWRHSSKPVARLQSWQMTEYHLLTQREQEIILCLQTGHKKLKQNVWKLWLAPKQPIPLLRSRAGNSRTHPAGLPKPQVAEGGLLERQHSLHCNCVKQPRRPKD